MSGESSEEVDRAAVELGDWMEEMKKIDSTLVSCTTARIERVVKRGWRGTPTAQFLWNGNFFLCDVWFEDGESRMQVRSSANGLEEAAVIGMALQMAIEWAAEQSAEFGALPIACDAALDDAPDLEQCARTGDLTCG